MAEFKPFKWGKYAPNKKKPAQGKKGGGGRGNAWTAYVSGKRR